MASGSRTVIVTRMSLHCQTCCQGRNTGTAARRGGGDGGGSPQSCAASMQSVGSQRSLFGPQ